MNHRERFHAVMEYRPFDRLPIYFFGTWAETKERWKLEGLERGAFNEGSGEPQLEGMDPEWERGLWGAQGLVNIWPIADGKDEVLEETDAYRIVRSSLGSVTKWSKQGSSIPEHIEEAIKPTRESWNRFKTFLDPHYPSRYTPEWEARAEELNRSDRVVPFLAGSLYGMPCGWMGVEGISYLLADDLILYEEIVEHMAEFYMELYRPLLKRVKFDLAYFFEDCCFNTGPLFSPNTYRQIYHKYYRKMTEFYHEMGVSLVMLDSDGKVDQLIPCWLESGFDILFPIEVGTWHADPVKLRKQYGKSLRMFGGVDKHVIPQGEAAIRRHLEPLRGLVAEGGYIPIPDHRSRRIVRWNNL